MSRYILSKRSGVPQSTISEICSSKATSEKCSADTLYKISKALNVTMESIYLLAMVDYISRENEVPLCTKYNDIRRCKMQETLYPASVVTLNTALNTDHQRQESLSKAIPEFLRFNIVECEVRNVC